MKKIIIKIICFFIILLLILVIISKIFIPKDNLVSAGIIKNNIRMMSIFAEPEDTLDVVVIGDSESYTSFIPLEAWNEYGYTSYVSGAPWQKLSDINILLTEILKRQNPKIVMLETNIIYRKIPKTEIITQPAKTIFPVFEYHDRWKSLQLNDWYEMPEYKNMEPNKGFYLNNTIKASLNKEHMKETEKCKELGKLNRLYVEKIKKACELNGAELVLYSCPSTKNWNMQKHNGIEMLAKEIDLEYIDLNLLNDEIQIDWTKDTRDAGDHLNYTGALKTSKFLTKYLSEKNLPNHKDDSNYKEWDTLYQKYKEKVSKYKSSN